MDAFDVAGEVEGLPFCMCVCLCLCSKIGVYKCSAHISNSAIQPRRVLDTGRGLGCFGDVMITYETSKELTTGGVAFDPSGRVRDISGLGLRALAVETGTGSSRQLMPFSVNSFC